MAYLAYNVIVTLGFITMLPFLPLLLVSGPRFRAGLAQRFGFYPAALRAASSGVSRPIWIHAASVGEVMSVRPLTAALKQRFPQRKILLSTFTQTGHLMARQNPNADGVFYVPLDLPWSVRRALAAFDPGVLIIVETEIWPNLLCQAHERGVPAILLSGRVSEEGFRSYFRLAWFFRQVFRRLAACGMQSELDRERIIRLGVAPNKVSIIGSLKQAAPSSADGDSVRPEGGRGDGFLWVVGSSHRGEEGIVLDAYMRLKETFSHLRMVLAPRHPQRFAEVERLLVDRGISFVKKSQLDGHGNFGQDVMLLDTIGDLVSFYAEADVAFVGGTLVDAGGHNLLEPARLGKPVLFGPYTSNTDASAQALKRTGGGIEVLGADDLVREIGGLLSEPRKYRAASERAYEVAAPDSGVLQRSVDVVAGYLAAPPQDRC